MARTLLKWLIKIAKDRGLISMMAYTRSDNLLMQNIFLDFGFTKMVQNVDEIYFELALNEQQQ